MIKLVTLLIALSLTGCSTGRVVIEQHSPARIVLKKDTSIEVQSVTGRYAENFKIALAQALATQTPFRVVHSQNRNELIDARLRAQQNRQYYPQADLLIRGESQEFVEKRSNGGAIQFAGTSRLYLQLIKTDTGEILLSDYYIGTSLSNTYLQNSNTIYDGSTDALNSARNVALEKFISQLTPQRRWLEIDLVPYRNAKKFNEVRNLISYGKLDLAKEKTTTDLKDNSLNDSEKGKILFTLSVIESLQGHFESAKKTLLQSHQLLPSETIIKYLEQIERMDAESKKLAQAEKTL